MTRSERNKRADELAYWLRESKAFRISLGANYGFLDFIPFRRHAPCSRCQTNTELGKVVDAAIQSALMQAEVHWQGEYDALVAETVKELSGEGA